VAQGTGERTAGRRVPHLNMSALRWVARARRWAEEDLAPPASEPLTEPDTTMRGPPSPVPGAPEPEGAPEPVTLPPRKEYPAAEPVAEPGVGCTHGVRRQRGGVGGGWWVGGRGLFAVGKGAAGARGLQPLTAKGHSLSNAGECRSPAPHTHTTHTHSCHIPTSPTHATHTHHPQPAHTTHTPHTQTPQPNTLPATAGRWAPRSWRTC
jgi:hypothetical protein